MLVTVIHLTPYDSSKEKIIHKVCTLVGQKLKLPDNICILLKKLEPSIYGETSLQTTSQYKIVLNGNLPLPNTIEPLVHELIHLHQIYTGQLIGKKHCYLWNGIEYKVKNGLTQNFVDYQLMPWELDVTQKLPKLLEYVLSTN